MCLILLIEDTVKSVINGKLDRFPAAFLNLDYSFSKELIEYWNEFNDGMTDYSKTVQAQLQFIYSRIT